MKKGKQGPNVKSKILKRKLLIEELKKKCWSVPELAQHFNVAQSTIYRYLIDLEEEDIGLGKDFEDFYGINTAKTRLGDDLSDAEWKFIGKLVRASKRSPLRDGLVKKLTSKADLKKSPNLLLQPHLADFIDKLEKAISSRRQVVLKGYHSGNSNSISDRLVEPIHFGDNYQTIFVLDTKDKICKYFLLERMDDVEVKRIRFKFEELHIDVPTDMFGYSGKTNCTITLKMSLRARLALKKYPLAEPYITKEKDYYIFKGPVSSFDGIGAFVLENLNDIKVLESVEFREYLLKRIKGATV